MLNARTILLAFAVVLLVLTATGCATTSSTPKAITEIKQVVGSWDGWIGCSDCSEPLRSSLSIRDDGQWEMVNERNPSYYGKVGIVDGVLRWGVANRWVGLVTLVEEREREWLTLLRANGEVWTEFNRARR